MAKELGRRGIAVNAVAPGAIETDFGGGAVRDNPELNQQFSELTALGRVGLLDDIGPMTASLPAEATRWATALRMDVSGGPCITSDKRRVGDEGVCTGRHRWRP